MRLNRGVRLRSRTKRKVFPYALVAAALAGFVVPVASSASSASPRHTGTGPTVSVPSVSVPTVSVPTVTVPTVPTVPTTVPTVTVPTVPTVTLPPVTVPTTPPVTLPTLPTPTLPTGSVLAPLPAAPPSISGSAAVGQTLTCSTGVWLNSPSQYAFSWNRDLTSGVGAGNTYTVSTADTGHAITCTVVASNAAGSASATSLPVIPTATAAAVPVNTGIPVITGSAVQGQTLGCAPGSWTASPTGYAYTWLRNATPISGQASGQYTLGSTDVGQIVTCAVVAQNASGNSLPAVSAGVVPRQPPAPGGGGSGSGTGPAKVPAPTLRSFSASPRSVTVLVRGKHRSTSGTTFHYTLDRSAGLLIEVQQSLAGRLQGGHCVAVTAHNRRGRGCTRWTTIKVLKVISAKAGASGLKYAQLLAVGTYRAYAAAVNAGGWSKVEAASFVVRSKLVAPPRPRRPRG